MQHLGLISIILLTICLTFTVIKWPGGLHMTFSQHAAKNRSSKIFYSLFFILILPVLLAFFSLWFVPTKHLPVTFTWIVWLVVVFQILCTFVPEDGGRKTVIHRVLTGISGIMLLPLMLLLAIAPSIQESIQNMIWVALLAMVGLLVVALMNQKGYKYALLLQAGYYLIFFATILVIMYL